MEKTGEPYKTAAVEEVEAKEKGHATAANDEEEEVEEEER